MAVNSQSASVTLPTDERGRRYGQSRCREHGVRTWSEAWILLENPALQFEERRPGLEPELLVHASAEGRVVIEGLGLSFAAVERQHDEFVHTLAKRVLLG